MFTFSMNVLGWFFEMKYKNMYVHIYIYDAVPQTQNFNNLFSYHATAMFGIQLYHNYYKRPGQLIY